VTGLFADLKGSVHAEAGHSGDARAHLTTALHMFERMQMAYWAARAALALEQEA